MGRPLAISPGTRSGSMVAALALLLVAVAAPRASVAQESRCGGHLSPAGPSTRPAALGLDQLAVTSGTAPAPPGPDESPAPGRPCRGPSCSRAPAPPPDAAGADSPTIERWVVLDFVPHPRAAAALPLPPSGEPLPVNPSPEGPLRPPRAGTAR